MANKTKATAFITAENAPSVTIEAIRHLLVLQNVSIRLQLEMLVKEGHLAEDQVDEYLFRLMEKYNASVHDYLLESIQEAQAQIDKQRAR